MRYTTIVVESTKSYQEPAGLSASARTILSRLKTCVYSDNNFKNGRISARRRIILKPQKRQEVHDKALDPTHQGALFLHTVNDCDLSIFLRPVSQNFDPELRHCDSKDLQQRRLVRI
jgi:hypothetical protein